MASLLTEDIYRHKNGLKHINLIDSEGFSALFVVNTPVVDNSGVAHGVEHMVFRGSSAFPQPVTLFQLTSLTDAKVNASTFADTTYFHCQSQCPDTFNLAIKYLLNGLFNPVFNAKDLQCEIHDGKDKGVIYQELLGAEQADKNSTKESDKNNFCYGGVSASIGNLSLKDLTNFHQRFYQANNITLVTANADIAQISHLISLLPKQKQQFKPIKVVLNKYNKTQDIETAEHNKKKYPQTIKKLIAIYHQWLQDPCYQQIDNYKEITNAQKALVADTYAPLMFSHSKLIPSLICLSNHLIEKTIIDEAANTGINNGNIKQSTNKTLLPNLFTQLCLQVKKQLNNDKANHDVNHSYASDQRNALWLTKVNASEQVLANIASYIISAYPKFLAPRCQGSCYATQALTIESSAYLAIYSAFDITPDKWLENIPHCLLELSQDHRFISMSLALAKIKYCRVNQVRSSQVENITFTDISTYLLRVAHNRHPKV
ncbi:MAG: insulinase family protein [Colwellia sp.]|nr:insulinase family protein [Colwellia sp.]